VQLVVLVQYYYLLVLKKKETQLTVFIQKETSIRKRS